MEIYNEKNPDMSGTLNGPAVVGKRWDTTEHPGPKDIKECTPKTHYLAFKKILYFISNPGEPECPIVT